MTDAYQLLALIFFVLFAIEAVLHRMDLGRWEEKERSLLDRVQAQQPGVLGELTGREWASDQRERVQAEEEKQATPRAWKPPEAPPRLEDDPQADLRRAVVQGDARFL